MDDKIRRLEELVEQNDDKAMYDLALEYIKGNEVGENIDIAFQLLNEAVVLCNIDAMLFLADWYQSLGKNMREDEQSKIEENPSNSKKEESQELFNKAIELYETAVNLGNVEAMVKLAYMYENHLYDAKKFKDVFDFPEKRVEELYKNAANLGNAEAMCRLGDFYRHSRRHGKDVYWYKRAVEMGNTEAMCTLGLMYSYGDYCIAKDFTKAKKLFIKAIYLNDFNGLRNLRIMYGMNGITLDDKEAKELYEQVIKFKSSKFLIELGRMYSETWYLGYGDYRNPQDLYKKAVEMGDVDGLSLLVNSYVGKNIDEEMLNWLYKKSIELDALDAMLTLAEMFEEGKKISEDLDKAQALYEKVIDKCKKLCSEKNISSKNKKRYLIMIENAQGKLNYIHEKTKRESSKSEDKANMLRPDLEGLEELKSLVSDLSSKYVAREQTVRMLANNIYHGRKIMKSVKDSKTIRDNISTILLISSTGGGKTAIVSDLAKSFNVPFTSASLSAGYTQAGYKGLDLKDIFKKLIEAANGNVKKAEEGIIILDEFDKLRIKDDVHDEGFKRALQQELLSYLEGKEVELYTKKGEIIFDPSRVTFILAGAFQDITEYDMNYSDEDIKEAISKGYESELLGRIEIYHYMRKYTKEEYINILNDSKISPLTNFIVSCSIHGKNVITSPYSPFIESVAEEAVKLDKGVRGLNSIFANILNWYLDDLIYGESDISLMESYETIKKKKGRGK